MDKIKVINGSQGKAYNLIAYFKLTDLDEKFIIFNDEKNAVDLHYAKIKVEKNNVKIVKPSDKEMAMIDRIVNNSKSIRHRKVPSRDLYYLVYDGEIVRTISRKEYNELLQSPLVKKQERNNKLAQILKEKEELQRELDKLKKENKEELNRIDKLEEEIVAANDTSWEHVKEESRYITDDKLLSNIEKEMRELELDEFYEKCKVNIVRVLVVNLISLILVAILLYGSLLINYAFTLFGKSEVFTNIYFNDVLKMYGVSSLIVLFLQVLTLGTYRNFFSKITMFVASVILIYTFTQMINGYVYSFGVIGVFMVAILNIIINFSLYLQLQLKLM